MSLWNCCQVVVVSLSTGLRIRCSLFGWPRYSYYIWYRGQFKAAIWKGREKGRGRLKYRKKERVTEWAISITLRQSRPVLKKERWDGRSRLRNARKCLHSSLMSHSEPPVWHRKSILDEMKWQETHEIQTFLWCIFEFAWPFDGVNCCSSVKAYRSCVYFVNVASVENVLPQLVDGNLRCPKQHHSCPWNNCQALKGQTSKCQFSLTIKVKCF